MGQRSRLVVGALSITLLAGGQLAATTGSGSASPGRADGARAAVDRLHADATGSLTVVGRAGSVTFVGAGTGTEVDNPGVTATADVAAAARAHLTRYGSALGADRAATGLVQTQTTRTVSGQDVVRFTQQVGGLPVIGGEVVVSLRPDRELGSILSTLSRSTRVSTAVVPEHVAARRAAAAGRKAAGRGLTLTHQGRWLFDPAVLGAPTDLGARSVWRFEVGDGAGVRRVVLVDDHTGWVLMNLDQVAQIDRVICDDNNVPQVTADPCTSGFARAEGDAPSLVPDVNDAYDFSDEVSDFYDVIGDIDLTATLGIDIGGVKRLASTVRFCDATQACPYENAFWNGTQMFYGQDFASADDVVGHEMTHGIIDRNSRLFYWGQSGAINESIADIMGEIVDHRNGIDDDSAFDLSEDLPIGAIRNLADPTLHGDPDRVLSPSYTLDRPDYLDNGGVHTNSGVSNKTAYLISQGGTFNGQTITGIDGTDATMTKTALLYMDVIRSLTSGSDFADLAAVLDQTCQSLVGTSGFVAADCVNVHKAGLATELRTAPVGAEQPAEPGMTCPPGNRARVLLDSETGNAAAKFVAGPQWVRGPTTDFFGTNAVSGLTSWYGADPGSATTDPLVAASGIALPAGRPAYLLFHHWYVYDYYPDLSDVLGYFDGGTVEVDDLGTPAGPVDMAARPWVNGPDKTLSLFPGTTNPSLGKTAFSGDSSGWTASRLDLSSFAGRTVKPRFTTRADSFFGLVGWFLDDIKVYTCDLGKLVVHKPVITGVAKVGKKLTARPGAWGPAGVRLSYQWLRGSQAIASATSATYKVKGADRGKTLKVRVTGRKAGYATSSATSSPTRTVPR